MDLKEKIKVVYSMMTLIENLERRELLAFAVLRYIAGWGILEFEDEQYDDAFGEIVNFLGEIE